MAQRLHEELGWEQEQLRAVEVVFEAELASELELEQPEVLVLVHLAEQPVTLLVSVLGC